MKQTKELTIDEAVWNIVWGEARRDRCSFDDAVMHLIHEAAEARRVARALRGAEKDERILAHKEAYERDLPDDVPEKTDPYVAYKDWQEWVDHDPHWRV
jgi:hypothetical protein